MSNSAGMPGPTARSTVERGPVVAVAASNSWPILRHQTIVPAPQGHRYWSGTQVQRITIEPDVTVEELRRGRPRKERPLSAVEEHPQQPPPASHHSDSNKEPTGVDSSITVLASAPETRNGVEGLQNVTSTIKSKLKNTFHQFRRNKPLLRTSNFFKTNFTSKGSVGLTASRSAANIWGNVRAVEEPAAFQFRPTINLHFWSPQPLSPVAYTQTPPVADPAGPERPDSAGHQRVSKTPPGSVQSSEDLGANISNRRSGQASSSRGHSRQRSESVPSRVGPSRAPSEVLRHVGEFSRDNTSQHSVAMSVGLTQNSLSLSSASSPNIFVMLPPTAIPDLIEQDDHNITLYADEMRDFQPFDRSVTSRRSSESQV